MKKWRITLVHTFVDVYEIEADSEKGAIDEAIEEHANGWPTIWEDVRLQSIVQPIG